MDDTVMIGAPMFDDSLSLVWSNKDLIISDSASDIALFLGLPISFSALALNLMGSLPYYPFQFISMWEGVKKVHPFCILKCNSTGTTEELEVWCLPDIDNDVESAYKSIREQLLSSLDNYANMYSAVQADISGGVDSATIVYMLNALNANFSLYHAAADSKWNSDSKWARLIANDIDRTFIKLPSIGESGRKFSFEMDCSGSILADSPIFWADTEGYVNSIFNATYNHSETIHFTGLGGDELFSPLPAHAWSVARQNKIRSIGFGFKYCMFTRSPFLTCAYDLMNKTTFKDAVKTEIDIAFGEIEKRKKNSVLNWCGPITVPSWFTKICRETIYNTALKELDKIPCALDSDRTRHQGLESILFQRRVISQLNRLYGGITWISPFLESNVVSTALSIPARYRRDYALTKPTLYNSLKGIIPQEVFTRGFKGDYSTGRYKEFNEAISNIRNQIWDFKLVELGLIDPDILISELSMPNALQDRVESFERLVAVERWVRNATCCQMKKE